MNHSTHCPGLVPVLQRLSKLLPDGTIVPGPMSVVRASRERFTFIPKETMPSSTSKPFRLVARMGTVVQEVLVLTTASADQLRRAAATAAAEGRDRRRMQRPHTVAALFSESPTALEPSRVRPSKHAAASKSSSGTLRWATHRRGSMIVHTPIRVSEE